MKFCDPSLHKRAWVRKELGWGILACGLLLLLLGFPEVKPLTRVVRGIPCCSPNCAGTAEAALCGVVGEEMSCRGGQEHLKPVLPPETSRHQTTGFLTQVGAVFDDSSRLTSAERERKEGLGHPLLPAAWAGSALLQALSHPLGCGIIGYD